MSDGTKYKYAHGAVRASRLRRVLRASEQSPEAQRAFAEANARFRRVEVKADEAASMAYSASMEISDDEDFSSYMAHRARVDFIRANQEAV